MIRNQRKSQVGTGARAEKIRTYNYKVVHPRMNSQISQVGHQGPLEKRIEPQLRHQNMQISCLYYA
ncbi:hypothetical protein Syun_028886 [Stephania yunnanensis]|uniref:Uncharacterized protein n=1 Tax=Stephania yunnanensis TaxID=152371 RepID=A0AAP0E8X7_9MAGN